MLCDQDVGQTASYTVVITLEVTHLAAPHGSCRTCSRKRAYSFRIGRARVSNAEVHLPHQMHLPQMHVLKQDTTNLTHTFRILTELWWRDNTT
jgi:hypothetical protein